MPVVAHVPIKILFLPKLAALPNDSIALLGGKGLPGVENAGKRKAINWREQSVHVIRHYDPPVQQVTLAVEVEQGVLDQLGYTGVSEPDVPQTQVEIGLDQLAPPGSCLVLGQTSQLIFESLKAFFGKGICEAKGDRLRNTPSIEVRQVASRIPSSR